MSKCKILGFFGNNIQIEIIPSHWRFMQMGEGHIILENSNQNDMLYDQVLSVCRHQIGSIPCQLQTIYHKILLQNQDLEPFLLKRQELLLDSKQRIKFIAMMKAIIDIPIHEYKVFLAQNLARSKDKWDYYLQFKPKTILPDVYSEQFIRDFSTKHHLNFLELSLILTNSPLIQKTRWFKKNALKEVKKNFNPFEIFSYKTSKFPNYLKKIKRMKKEQTQSTSLTPSLQHLSNQMISRIISKTDVLPSILKMQLLFTEAHDFKESNVCHLWKCESNKQNICKSIYNQICTELKSNESIDNTLQSLFGQAPNLSIGKRQRNEIQKIMRFLISWTWKDVSIILRFKLDQFGKDTKDFDLKIIDYEIKEASKLAETIKKDYIFLRYYLTQKKVL